MKRDTYGCARTHQALLQKQPDDFPKCDFYAEGSLEKCVTDITKIKVAMGNCTFLAYSIVSSMPFLGETCVNYS